MDIAVNEVVRQYAQQVNERYNPKAIYLYGSHARGTNKETSDIDIAVIVEPINTDRYIDIFADLFSIAAKMKANIEPNLLIDDGAYNKYSFLAEVLETGLPIET